MMSYYQQAHGIVLVYDITDRDSFESLKYWIEVIEDKCVPETRIMIIGNKTDLKDQRKVSLQEGMDYAEAQNCFFMETSAKENLEMGVEKAFEELITCIGKVHVPLFLKENEKLKPIRADIFEEEGRELKKTGCC